MHTTLLVLAHHRGNSLTAQVAARIRRRLEAEGIVVDFLDLHDEGFDPRMTLADEPEWRNPGKKYSAEVTAQMRRIDAADSIIVVFPVWWSAPPAILKGWIDRVWNHGFAYGSARPRLTDKRMLWVAMAAGSMESLALHHSDELIDRQLRVEISNFCGITDARVRIICNTHIYEPQAIIDIRQIFAAADMVIDEFLDVRTNSTMPDEALPGKPTSGPGGRSPASM